MLNHLNRYSIRGCKSVAAIITVAVTLFVTGCDNPEGGRRATSNSSDLNGLWRMNVESSQSGLLAQSNSSFILNESGSNLSMIECNGRSTIPLARTGSTIDGLPAGPFAIVDNDTLSASSSLGDAEAKKMDLDTQFDMGNISFATSAVGSNNFTDICVLSSDARVLGVATQETYSAVTFFNGNPLLVELMVMGAISERSYAVNREATGNAQAEIRLVSESFRAAFNRTEFQLRNGTLTITEDSDVWLRGTYSADLPNGDVINGTFNLEKP